MSARPKSPDAGDVHLSRSVLDRLGALTGYELAGCADRADVLLRVVKGITIDFPVAADWDRFAKEVLKWLAAQPAPAVMGEGAARKRLLYEPLGDFSFSQHVAAKLSTLLTAKYTNSQKIVAGIIKQEIEAVFREVDAEGRTAAAESREEPL